MSEGATEGSSLPGNPDTTSSQGDSTKLPEIDLPKTPLSSSSSTTSSLSNKNGKEKTVPHYLKASEGSCHDFCKYGRKHSFELKGKPALKRGTHWKIPPLSKSQSRSADSLKSKLTRNGKLCTSDSEVFKRQGISTESRDIRSTSGKNTSQKVHRTVDFESDGRDLRHAEKLSTSLKPKIMLKVPSLKRASQSGSTSRGDLGGPPSKKPAVSGSLKKSSLKSEKPFSALKSVSELKKPSVAPEPRTLLKRPSLKARVFHPYLKRAASSVKDKIGKEEGSYSGLPLDLKSTADEKKKSNLRRDSVLKRVASAVKGKIVKEDESSSGPSVNRKSTVGENKKSNIRSGSALLSKTVSSIKGRSEKEDGSSSGSLMNRKSSVVENRKSNLRSNYVPFTRVASSSKSKIGKEDGSSSNLPMHRKSTEGERKKLNLRPVSLLVKSSPAENLRGVVKEKAFTAIGSRSVKKKVVTKLDRKVNSEVKFPAAYRLTFRSGKVVNSRQADVDPPRRLKFRQVKRISSSLSESGKRSFKRKEFSQGQTSRHKETLKVVLRHQEVNNKKEGQSLLNEVIELTAIKLAETSKSKVKALVGAFETVISLQEGKPSAAPA